MTTIADRVVPRRCLDGIMGRSGVGLRPSHPETMAVVASHCALIDLLQRLYDCSHYDGGPGHTYLVVPDHMLEELKEVAR